MEELNIPEKLKNNLQSFIQGLKDVFGDDLISLILYGSAASGEFVNRHSNLNLLVLLKSAELRDLKKASGLVGRYRMVNPLFLTESYIASSTDTFPVEFLDMQENYLVLYGKDALKGIIVETKNLRFQCEQELKSKLINLRQLYLLMNKDKLALRNLLFKSFNSILHILRNVLRLSGKGVPYKKEDVLKGLVSEFNIDIDIWGKIFSAKKSEIKLSRHDIEPLFVNFVRELEKIVQVVDRL
ncbi:MAG: hypothetical protein AABY28_00205 [Candidatus Omnitrophota bacterium]